MIGYVIQDKLHRVTVMRGKTQCDDNDNDERMSSIRSTRSRSCRGAADIARGRKRVGKILIKI